MKLPKQAQSFQQQYEDGSFLCNRKRKRIYSFSSNMPLLQSLQQEKPVLTENQQLFLDPSENCDFRINLSESGQTGEHGESQSIYTRLEKKKKKTGRIT